jgi:hypothetical protein
MPTASVSSATWRTPEDAVAAYSDRGLTAHYLDILLEIGSLTLGRRIKSRPVCGGKLVYIPDVEEELATSRTRSADGTYSHDWPKHQGFSLNGVEYRTGWWGKNDLGLKLGHQSLMRYHQDGTIMLFKGKTFAPEKLCGHEIPVYTGNGIAWLGIWAWRKDQYERLKTVRDAGRIIHPKHGEGYDYREAENLAVGGQDVLDRATKLPAAGGKPFLELEGELLKDWPDGYRVMPRTRKAKDGSVIEELVEKQVREFSKPQLDAVCEARRLARESGALSDSEIMELCKTDQRFQFQTYKGGTFFPIFEDGDLLAFRNAKSDAEKRSRNGTPKKDAGQPAQRLKAYLGGMLGSVKLPTRFATRDDEGEWRTPFQNVLNVAAELKKRLRTEDNPYPHTDGKEYVPGTVFLDVSGYGQTNSGILQEYVDRAANMTGRDHKALARPIASIPFNLRDPEQPVPRVYIRKGGVENTRLYLLDDAHRIREYRKAHLEETRGGRLRAFFEGPDAVPFVKDLVAHNNGAPLAKINELGTCEQKKGGAFPKSALRKAWQVMQKPGAGYYRKKVNGGVFALYKEGQQPGGHNPKTELPPEWLLVPSNAQPTPTSTNGDAGGLKQAKRPRGRPSGAIDKKAAKRNQRMREAMRNGEFDSITELARAFHVSRTRASEIINA